ncbi:hypothetical protein TWF481_006282 [Arthrobotrys musiformis]|uniref:Uncharacterized protein n=1 Tax=Arthrobotrys musiformis TaxID=47236 RepID=A0AAV9WGS6_9PEZI
MSTLAVPPNRQAAQEYLSNCAFLNLLAAGNKKVRKIITDRAEEYRMLVGNARYLTKYRFTTMKNLLDELAGLLVACPDEAVAIAVEWLTKDEICLVATINPADNVKCGSSIERETLTERYAEWQYDRVEEHAAKIFQLSHEYLEAQDGETRKKIEDDFRVHQVEYCLPHISKLFKSFENLLDEIIILEEHFFKPHYLELLEPTEDETKYFVDKLPSSEPSRDKDLAYGLAYIYLQSDSSYESVKKRLRSRRFERRLHILTYENLYIWSQLFICAFLNAKLALKRAHELRAKGDETGSRERIRVLIIYLEYIAAFTNNSTVFRRYAGIIRKLADCYQEHLDIQEEFSDPGDVHPFDSLFLQDEMGNRKSGKFKPSKIGGKTRKAFKEFFAASKSALSTLRQKTGNTKPEDGSLKRRAGKKKRYQEEGVPKLKTENEFFQKCHELSDIFRRMGRFLEYVSKAEELTHRQVVLNVFRSRQCLPQMPTAPGEKLESCLYRFLHLNHLTQDEISDRVQSFLSFLHTVVPDPEDCQKLLSILNDDSPSFPTLYHAELTLLANLGHSPRLAYPYIGISRPPCVVCEHLIIRQRNLEAREGSGKVYALSLPRGIVQQDKEFLFLDIKDLTARVVNEIQTAERRLSKQREAAALAKARAAGPKGGLDGGPTGSRTGDR